MRKYKTQMRVDALKRKGAKAIDIAVSGAMKQASDKGTIQLAVGVGFIQGLKYNGNLVRGMKAGAVTVGVLAGVNAAANVAHNWEVIKKA